MTQTRRHVLVIGSVNADIVVEINRLPVRGETLAANKSDTGKFFPGGKGSNQAAAAARIIGVNHPTLCAKFAGQFGNDTHGGALTEALRGVGVDSELSGHPNCPSGQAFVFVYPDGDNSIVIVGGANASWPDDLPPALSDAIKSAAIVLLQCEIPPRINALVAKTAAETGVPVMFDTGGEDTPISADVLPHLTYVCPNETELARLTKREVNSTDDAISAARFLQEQGAKNVLVTLGSDGSVFVPADGSEVTHQRCFKVNNVVDTTGAGDCYRGAFAVAYAEGREVQDCMARAAAAGALCVQRAGALPSLPSGDEVVEFLKANDLKMTQTRRHILVVGSVGADFVVEIDRMPVRGETLAANKPDTGNIFPGGKGDNQAAAAAKIIGVKNPTVSVKFAGQIGNDSHGGMLIEALQGAGVDTALSGRPNCRSGQAYVFVFPDGDNSIVIVSGANAAWPEALPTELTDAIQSAAIVLVQCEIPVRVNALMAKAAAKTNVPVMYDNGGDDFPIPADILPLLTYVCPNETELARLTKREVNNTEDAIAAARFLQEQGAKNVLVTLGSDGSVFVPSNGSEVIHQPSFKVNNVVDTTGAGDCYRGAFAVAYTEGRDVQDCMARAAAASALCVQRNGALPSLPSGDEVVEFLKANGR
ncbi:hypothetical protein BBJ29_001910 [Phytophthora kernoviae]|uniref:Ribokinase n=1 Tax=Phytophthora kernoviae TaxID=325452 RepID=A0A3R7JIT6_9STRA|nr:hypothetical protein BBJ29_001910 [Phytophthora kernoviae]